MIKINFKQFLLEAIAKTKHYSERTSISDIESRACHKSPLHKKGWQCKELIEVSSTGEFLNKRITLENFLKISSNLKNESIEELRIDFIDKVQTGIQKITNNTNIWDIMANYPHMFVNLGKIAIELKNGDNSTYYSPVLISGIIKSKESEKQKVKTQSPIKIKDIVKQGTNIWLVIKNNSAQTILFYPEGKEAFPFITKTCETNRAEQKYMDIYELKIEDYINEYVSINDNFIEGKTTYFIYDNTEWKNILDIQIKDPKYQFYKKQIPQEWKNIFKKESVLLSKGTILYTPELNIKKRTISEIVQYIKSEKAVEVKFDKIFSKNAYKIRLGNISIIREDKKIREIGKLPLKGELVKTYNIESFTSTGKNISMTARLLDVFVLDKNDNIIRSEYEKN